MFVIVGNMTAHVAWGQNDSYLIYGNRDGSVMPVAIGQTIDIPAWGATYDTVTFVHMPLASNDSAISARLGGYFPSSPYWDDESFLVPNPVENGWTNQSMLAFNTEHTNWFLTNGDTALICTYRMTVATDTALIGDTICPFQEGYQFANGGLSWGLIGGYQTVVPAATYPHLVILPPSDCNYIIGDINNDGILNGLDAIYGANYFRGGNPPPVRCDICIEPVPFYAPGDVNGSCSYNGLDIIYMVNYLKGGPGPHPCPDCLPGQ